MTVGEMKGLLEGVDDNFELVLTARQRLSVEELLAFETPIPYQYADVDFNLDEIDEEDRTVFLECDIPSPFFFQDN